MALQTIFVNEFTNGILGPDVPKAGTVKDGGFIVANTAAGCWGPMLTPAIRGGHEVTRPVLVEGAEVGDAIAIKIVSVKVTSRGTASGNDRVLADRCLGDPFVAAKCPQCGKVNESTHIEGIGQDAIRCDACGASAAPFEFTSGYTIAFDPEYKIGVTLDRKGAEKAAKEGREFMRTPDNSIQNPVVTLAPHDMTGMVSRLRPFLGQLGTTPARETPDSHNARDFGQFLIGAPHQYAITEEQVTDLTDGHMDINRVRAGAVVICPVRIPGGGVYLGDMHAMQGNGEIAGHTCDVSGVAVLQVSVLKGVELDGPVLLPVEEDLPYLAKPLTAEERKLAEQEAAKWDIPLEEMAPVSFVGTGANLNDAISCAMERAAKLLGTTVPRVMNRLTITGGLEIGRAPGTCTATFRAPVEDLKKAGIWELVKTQYEL